MVYVYEQDLAHYRLPVYKEISRLLNGRLKVYSAKPSDSKYLNTINQSIDNVGFWYRILKTKWLFYDRFFFVDIRPLLKVLNNASVVIIRHSVRDMSKIFLVLYLKKKNIPIIIWGQGYSRKRKFRPFFDPRDTLHLRIAKISEAYICYSDEIRDTLSKYISSEKLFMAKNTGDMSLLLKQRSEFDRIGKDKIKKELGLNKKIYLSFVGRLNPRKKPEVLLKLVEYLQKNMRVDVGLLIVGDGPLLRQLQIYASIHQIKDIHFYGELYGYNAARVIYSSDVVVIPGWLGLSGVDALGLGRPLVSQKTGKSFVNHPPEAAYLVDKINGRWALKEGIYELAECVMDVISNLDIYSSNAASYAEYELGFDQMIEGFMQAINFVKGS